MREKFLVSPGFRRNFEIFVEHRVASGVFTIDEIEGLREIIRKDLRPGPDNNRVGVDCLEISGVRIPATIDDVADRYRLWEEFLADEVEAIELANNERRAE